MRRKKKQSTEKIFEAMMADSFPNLMSENILQTSKLTVG